MEYSWLIPLVMIALCVFMMGAECVAVAVRNGGPLRKDNATIRSR